ncbi:MAG: hypothetical protein JWN76_915, partial [Chitinophagaceae bacterium]|nr:hypothetical protein [Chitinophagaceae bacterium]
PKSYTGAVHYSNKFDNEKQSLNGSYRYSKLNTEGFNNSLSETVIANNVIYSRDNTTNISSKFRHSANGTYDLQIDSFTSIKITANGLQGESHGTSKFYGEVLQESINKKSTRQGFSTTNGDNNSFNSSLLLRKRFRKPGRTISLNVDQQHNTNNSAGVQYTLNEYFSAAAKDSSRVVDQNKISRSDNNSVTSKFVYTEPLSKKVFMELSYSLRFSNNQSERLSYSADPTGKYNLFDSLYSNSYKYNYVINTGGVNFKYNTKKINLSGGTDVAKADFTQTDVLRSSSLKRQYTNLFPKGNFTYIFNQYSRFTLTYNGSTKQPSITQVQPVRDNTNTLYEAIGNPLLKQEFRQQFNVRFNSYKMLNQRGFSISMNMSTVGNAISRSETIAVTGKTVYQYINVNGNYNYNGYLNYGQKIKSIDAYFNVGLGLYGGRNISYVNNQKNITNTFTPNLNINFNKGKEKKYSINFYGNLGYNMSRSSLYPDRQTNYFTFQGYPSFNFQLPAKLEINMDAELNVRQKVSVFDNNNNAYLINGYIGRKILKNDKGLIKIMGYDILNQNKGYNRFINNNKIQESTYQVLSRYFSIGFLWNFAKTPAGMGPVNNF